MRKHVSITNIHSPAPQTTPVTSPPTIPPAPAPTSRKYQHSTAPPNKSQPPNPKLPTHPLHLHPCRHVSDSIHLTNSPKSAAPTKSKIQNPPNSQGNRVSNMLPMTGAYFFSVASNVSSLSRRVVGGSSCGRGGVGSVLLGGGVCVPLCVVLRGGW